LIQNQQNGGNFNIRNGMAEVKTGEGKSIVLAGLCCFLALKGYYTYCACYSSYLSQRDRKDY
jgi:preprotein translocase subunit SecA